MENDQLKGVTVMTCTDCGCIVNTSYWATHTGVCPGNKKEALKALADQQKHQMLAAGYWR